MGQDGMGFYGTGCGAVGMRSTMCATIVLLHYLARFEQVILDAFGKHAALLNGFDFILRRGGGVRIESCLV